MESEHESLVGPAWHDSRRKRELDAMLASRFGGAAIAITAATYNMLEQYGYVTFAQTRVGKDGELFPMYKIQTMESTTIPLFEQVPILPVAQMVRDLAFDELIQICHISTDPSKPDYMSMVGPRPQLPEEIAHMRETMARRGKEQQFCQWLSAYCDMRPGLFSIEILATENYAPNTPEFYEARMGATMWYYENASLELDTLIFGTNLALGCHRYHTMRMPGDAIIEA